MSRVKGRDTGIERQVRSALHRRGLRFRKHVKELAGKPDIVFRRARVAVFIDGDFWHGYGFPQWEENLSPFWKSKITSTRKRDRRNFARLRRMGWRVIRIWEHELEHDLESCVQRVVEALDGRGKSPVERAGLGPCHTSAFD